MAQGTLVSGVCREKVKRIHPHTPNAFRGLGTFLKVCVMLGLETETGGARHAGLCHIEGLVGDFGKGFLMSSGGVLCMFVRATPSLFFLVAAEK